jgi:hypothetical protein
VPYISKDRRGEIWDEETARIEVAFIHTPGELNYAFTEMLKEYAELKGHSYTTYNEIVGILECCKLEMYRRLAATYEDEKIVQNGDVY